MDTKMQDGGADGKFALVVAELPIAPDPGVLRAAVATLVPGGHLALIGARGSFDGSASSIGLTPSATIHWIAGETPLTSAADFAGGANQPCAAVSVCDELLVMRKPGERAISASVAAASRMPAAFFAMCVSPIWLVTPSGGPGIPLSLAERIVRFLSFHGDTVYELSAQSPALKVAARSHGRVWTDAAAVAAAV